jgi:uncharacterized protein YoxC
MKRRRYQLAWQSSIAAVAVVAWPQLGLCDTSASADVNLNDTKLTSAEKKLAEQKTVERDKYVNDQAQAINKIPGEHVTAEDLKESDVHKKGGFPNPLGWMLKPVTRLQEQSVKLEQEIMKLTGPIGSLQPSMLRLDKSMSSVQKQMGNMQGQINDVGSQMGSMQSDIRSMRQDLSQLKQPISDLRKPVMDLRDPVLALAKPVEGVEGRLVKVDAELSELKTLLALVLTAIFAAAVIIAIGTPIAAILVWRNRQKFVPATKPEEIHEEQKLAAAGKIMNREMETTGKSAR